MTKFKITGACVSNLIPIHCRPIVPPKPRPKLPPKPNKYKQNQNCEEIRDSNYLNVQPKLSRPPVLPKDNDNNKG